MRIGASLVLIAIGAILRFAVTTQHSHGVDLWAVGVILMIVGAIGALITLAFMTTRRRTDVTYRGTAPNGATTGYSSATYVEPGPMDPRAI